MQSLKVNPYSLKTVGEQTTQTEEIRAPLAECHNVEMIVKQEVLEEVTGSTEAAIEDRENEVDLDLCLEFEESHHTFNEPMMTVRLGTHPHQVTRLGSNAHRLVRGEIERVLISNSDLFAWSPQT